MEPKLAEPDHVYWCYFYLVLVERGCANSQRLVPDVIGVAESTVLDPA
ncbi:hypothetical protein FOXG_20399 [Fusarium oxysporum f. sp. lycopersici 4287]|uniref:Uncharacterized protein n=2 Tax=Fusarium oxysporum TaxID=5507 RepID=A0A0J9VHP4_FUSO4|nr:hypothetical protein FOXG_20399 [Fusarium oxysporum f. sp. lycopersici 4287]EXK46363.1 hypothetical protein FOMG_00086 [Fusarium oxysporum f. sp. melonis 26406]KNB10749.1 hypothetical protein FOXG_20399 [Fusarium oxysporum f. sp. lycopersici 4287]